MLKNACWHCNSSYRGRFYVWASGLCSLYRKIRYIEVLFHTFYCTYLWPGHRISFVITRTSLNRGSLNRGPPVQAKWYVHEQTSLSAYTVFSWPLERDFFTNHVSFVVTFLLASEQTHSYSLIEPKTCCMPSCTKANWYWNRFKL